MKKHYAKRDIYQEITDKIIAELEAGTVPWVKPWHRVKGESAVPANLTSGNAYRGINAISLMMSPYTSNLWATFNQARKLGGCVRKGAAGSIIVFWKFTEMTDRDDPSKTKTVPFVRHSAVFNIEQIDGLPPIETITENWEPIEDVDQVIANTGATIGHGGDRACFMPGPDRINMPHKASFDAANNYYATLLHELTHWTGHASRLARKYGRFFGTDEYAREELIAEMGAAFLCARTGIDGQLQHAAYLESWIKVLKADKKAIVQAASAAQKACDYVLHREAIREAA